VADGVSGNRLGEIVVFVAIGARQIAATDRNQMNEDRVVRGRHSFQNHLNFPHPALCRLQAAPTEEGSIRHMSAISHLTTNL
jgi:hypothetical protein